MKIGMVVLAGGVGRRVGRGVPKQFLLLGGKPLIVHVLERVKGIREIADIVVPCSEPHLAETRRLIANHGLNGRIRCIAGGTTRQESVYRGLEELAGCDSVVIHEAVRPLVTTQEFRDLIAAPDANAMYGIPIPFTVLKGHEYVESLLERSELVNVQLPQKFELAALRVAHESARREGRDFTEDASLFVHYGCGPVRILRGSDRNIKITVPSDILMAEAMYDDMLARG